MLLKQVVLYKTDPEEEVSISNYVWRVYTAVIWALIHQYWNLQYIFIIICILCILLLYSVVFQMYIKFIVYILLLNIFLSINVWNILYKNCYCIFFLLQKCSIAFPWKYHSSVLIITGFTSQTSILLYKFSSNKLL